MIFVLETIPSLCHFCLPLAIRSTEMCCFGSFLQSRFLSIILAVLFVLFCYTVLWCKLSQKLKRRKKFFRAGYNFSRHLCFTAFALVFFQVHYSHLDKMQVFGRCQICQLEPFDHQFNFLQCCIRQGFFWNSSIHFSMFCFSLRCVTRILQ